MQNTGHHEKQNEPFEAWMAHCIVWYLWIGTSNGNLMNGCGIEA